MIRARDIGEVGMTDTSCRVLAQGFLSTDM